MTQSYNVEVLSDIDGVIFQWFEGYAKFLQSKGIYYTGGNPTVFSMEDVFPHQPKPYQFINEFQASEMYVNTPLYDGVVESLTALKRAGIPVSFVTSCGDHDAIRQVRNTYLQTHLKGLYKECIFLPLGDDKRSVFEKFANSEHEVLMIDDQVAVLDVAAEYGITPVMKVMAYNKNEQRDYRRAFEYSHLADIALSIDHQVKMSQQPRFAMR